MNKTTIFTISRVILFSIVFLPACASQQATQAPVISPTESEQILDMANPAAVYCEALGYSIEAVTRESGEDADCIFPDGTRCAEWDFFAGRCGAPFSYCSTQGFTLEIEDDIAICRFPDGSFCQEFEYFSGECSPGDQPGMVIDESTQIEDVYQARDYMANYFAKQFSIQTYEEWIEQDITPVDAVGSSTVRFVSGPMTIVIAAPASAPSRSLYTIQEASFLSNGFYWEGTLSFAGEISEVKLVPPGLILNAEQARDAIMDYILINYDLPDHGEWIEQDIPQDKQGLSKKLYTSGPWVVAIEFLPAAPLVTSYHATVDNLQEEVRWEGDITIQGEINEVNYINLNQ